MTTQTNYDIENRDNLKWIVESLMQKINPTDNFIKNSIIEFAIIFRCEDLELFNDYYNLLKKKGFFVFHSDQLNVEEIIKLFKKKNNTDDESLAIKEFINNYWLNGYVYHLTTNLDAESIMTYGMDTTKKPQLDDTAPIKEKMDSLALNYYFPCEKSDTNSWSFATRLDLSNYYGLPEWFRVLIGCYDGKYKEEDIEQIIAKIKSDSLDFGNSVEVTDALEQLARKYIDKYKNYRRMAILIPLYKAIPTVKDIIQEYQDRNALDEFMDFIRDRFSNIKDLRSEEIVEPENLLCIDFQNNIVLTNENYRILSQSSNYG